MSDELNLDELDLSDPAVMEKLLEMQKRRMMKEFEEQQKALERLANTKLNAEDK